MFTVDLSPICPAEHKIQDCSSELLQIELAYAPRSVRNRPEYSIHQFSWYTFITQNVKPRKKQNQKQQVVPCKTSAKDYYFNLFLRIMVLFLKSHR